MFPGVENLRVFIRPGRTDMRKAINGLTGIARDLMAQDPLSGALFVFAGRSRRQIKLVYWDRNGFCLWMKRLEADRFPWPQTEEECREITAQQLAWLLRGIDFWREHRPLHFSQVS